MIGKAVLALLAVFLLLGAFITPINDGIKGWRTENTTQSAVVTTGAGVTTANVTLAGDLFQDDETEVISVSSNITETPIATSYVAATNYLLISALSASETRTLTINYYADTESTVLNAIGPFLSFLVIGGLLLSIAWGAVHKGRRG